jgi:pyruvate carboxylase subunit B
MKKFETTIDNRSTGLQIDPESSTFSINDGNSGEYSFRTQPNGRRLLRIGHILYKIDNVHITNRTIEFTLNGRLCRVDVRNEHDLLLDEMGFKSAAEIGEGQLKAPMPGKILAIMVGEGDEVQQGDPVAILEAMKMENELKAPIDGIIASVEASVNDSLEKNALILEIEVRG